MNNKVAIITPVFPPYRGGIGTVAYNQARVLGERGLEVTVLVPDYARTTPDPSSERRGFKIELLKPILKYGNAAWVPSLKKRLRCFSAKGGPASGWDVVILEYPFFGGMRAVYKAKKKYGFKLIFNYNMDVVAGGLLVPRSLGEVGKGLVFWYATKFFLGRIVKIADVVMASSEDYARHSALGKYWQSDNPKFQVISNGVDIKRFAFNDAPREPIVLFVGGLDKAHYFKGVEYLIRAMPLIGPPPGPLLSKGGGVLEDVPPPVPRRGLGGGQMKLVIAGKGELMETYKKLAHDLGVEDKVEFAGSISDAELARLYQTAAVTVLPSIDQSESFGIVLAESLSCGTPVIASDLPGVRSVFEDGVSGFRVLPKDIGALSEKIRYILDNPAQARQMGQAGRRLAEERYDWEKIGDELLKLVQN